MNHGRRNTHIQIHCKIKKKRNPLLSLVNLISLKKKQITSSSIIYIPWSLRPLPFRHGGCRDRGTLNRNVHLGFLRHQRVGLGIVYLETLWFTNQLDSGCGNLSCSPWLIYVPHPPLFFLSRMIFTASLISQQWYVYFYLTTSHKLKMTLEISNSPAVCSLFGPGARLTSGLCRIAAQKYCHIHWNRSLR